MRQATVYLPTVFHIEPEILLQIELRKDTNPDFKMSYQGELQQEYLQRFYSALSTIEFKTKESTVTLQAHFLVKKPT
jgi:hypothetical protein